MLSIDWYLETPLDFEYKNYIFLDYINYVDESYMKSKVSPYLLWNEKLFKELENFEKSRNYFITITERNKIISNNGIVSLDKIKIKEPEEIKIICDIVEYSKPILEFKIKMGYKILKKNPQILF